MQAVWLCIHSGRLIKDTFKSTQWGKVIQMWINSKGEFKHTYEKNIVEKSWTNATNVTFHFPRQAIWGHIWKRIVEKSQTNATNVTLLLLRRAIWRDIWKRIVSIMSTMTTMTSMSTVSKSFFYTNIFGYSFVWSLIFKYICVKKRYLRIFVGLNTMGVSKPSSKRHQRCR